MSEHNWHRITNDDDGKPGWFGRPGEVASFAHCLPNIDTEDDDLFLPVDRPTVPLPRVTCPECREELEFVPANSFCHHSNKNDPDHPNGLCKFAQYVRTVEFWRKLTDLIWRQP